MLVAFLGVLVFRILTRGVPRVLRWRRRNRESLLDEEAVARVKRQDTAITLIRNALRYVVFVIVVLVILSIFFNNPLPAVAGTTIIAAVIGFGAQSFLRDVIAGFSIVFEGQYSVGDFVHIKPQDVSGIVEELGLRMTKIRSLSGEVSYIPNGAMQGVVNYVSGQQRFNVEVQVSDTEAAARVESALGEASELYLSPPAPRRAKRGRRPRQDAYRRRRPALDGLARRGEPDAANKGRSRGRLPGGGAPDLQGGPGEPAEDKIPPSPGGREEPSPSGRQKALDGFRLSILGGGTYASYADSPFDRGLVHERSAALPVTEA